ncbi:hypothetical protein H8E88_24715 [candidate division KSB1 bacterium]|nr:hypothetical protein [candidate division KSB1 bacterium]
MAINMYCKNQKIPTQAYRDEYERIFGAPPEPIGIDEILKDECDCGKCEGLTIVKCLREEEK